MKILVGVGPDAVRWKAEGWYCNDVQSFPGVDVVGPCWKLPIADGFADHVLAKGMFEHLTYAQAAASLEEWRRVLRVGGTLEVEAPDVDEYIREYLRMKADVGTSYPEGQGVDPLEPADEEACQGIDRWLRRALWGWQRWPGDEHRSGWTESLLRFYLKKYFGGQFEIRRMAISFDEDVLVSRVRHLWARAVRA